jgi:hypothetical protein
MEIEKSRVTSQVRVFKTQTRNPTRKTRLLRVFLNEFILNIMFNHVLNIFN